MIRSHCCLCVTLDMLLLFPEPQSSQLYNGRVRENQRDMRTETGEVGGGEGVREGSRGWRPREKLCSGDELNILLIVFVCLNDLFH